jgi:hypothetical protein
MAEKKKSVRQIVEEQVPNFRVVEPLSEEDSHRRIAPELVTPDLASLRRKFLGEDRRRGRDAAAATVVREGGCESEIVLVEPKNANIRHRGAGAKAVVIANGKIVGMQG